MTGNYARSYRNWLDHLLKDELMENRLLLMVSYTCN